MKHLSKLILLLLLPLVASSQQINDANTFQKVKTLAASAKKPIMLIVEFTPPGGDNKFVVIAKKTLNDPTVVKLMKSNFFVFRTQSTDTAIRDITSRTKIKNYPSYIFMHPNGDVFHRDFGYSHTNDKYLSMIKTAVAYSKQNSMATLEKAYLANKTDNITLKNLIQYRQRIGMNNPIDIVEQYVENLRPEELDNYQTVLLALEMGPVSYGKAHGKLSTNKKIIDSIFKTEPLQRRINLTNTIINNSMQDAIKNKNAQQAYAVAAFTRNTWGKDYNNGNKNHQMKLVQFYDAIKDTTTYFKHAINYYDRYFMLVSADSAKKIDDSRQKQMLIETFKNGERPKVVSTKKRDSIVKTNKPLMVDGKVVKKQLMVLIDANASSFANELNYVAYKFYQTGTKNLDNLSKAMLWSKRSIELNPTSSYYDTLAHIYYAMNIYDEALTTQQVAITMAKNQDKAQVNNFQSEYEKMKNKSL